MRTKLLTTGLAERSLALLDKLVEWRKKDDSPMHLRVGLAGEDAAFFHLLRNGYTVVARRWSAGNLPGDVDLIAWKGDLLCIVEVKTRSAHTITPAEAAVDEHKRHILRRLARAYMRQIPQVEAPEVRFDVMSVYLLSEGKPEILHFESAFGWTTRYAD